MLPRTFGKVLVKRETDLEIVKVGNFVVKICSRRIIQLCDVIVRVIECIDKDFKSIISKCLITKLTFIKRSLQHIIDEDT